MMRWFVCDLGYYSVYYMQETLLLDISTTKRLGEDSKSKVKALKTISKNNEALCLNYFFFSVFHICSEKEFFRLVVDFYKKKGASVHVPALKRLFKVTCNLHLEPKSLVTLIVSDLIATIASDSHLIFLGVALLAFCLSFGCCHFCSVT